MWGFNTRSGGHYAGVDTLKMRLLPWLGTCFSIARPSVTDDTSLQLIQVITAVAMPRNTAYHIKKIHQNYTLHPEKKYIKMTDQFQISSSVLPSAVVVTVHYHLLSSGFSGKGPKDQGALCLPWQQDTEDGHWAVLHSPAAGFCQRRVSLNEIRKQKQSCGLPSAGVSYLKWRGSCLDVVWISEKFHCMDKRPSRRGLCLNYLYII